MVLECIEPDGQSTVRGRDRVRIVPLQRESVSAICFLELVHTCLQIHSDTVPKVHGKPVRVIAVVESAAVFIEFIAKLQSLCLSVDVLARSDVLWCVGINQTSPNALEEWSIRLDTVRI